MGKKEYKVVIAGSRSFNDYKLLEATAKHFLSEKMKTHDVVVISGCALGADALGIEFAKRQGLKIQEFPADWENMSEPCVQKVNRGGHVYNALAGHKRNREMSHAGHALIAFWNGKSKGTADMINIMERAGKPVRVVEY